MSNKNTQKKNANGGVPQKRSKPETKDTSIENISDATRKKIENITAVTSWQVSEDIFNLLRECNFDEHLAVDKILSGDAGRPGDPWKEVTRARKQKETQVAEQQPDSRPPREKQNRARSTGRGGRANGQPAKRSANRQQQVKRGAENRLPAAPESREGAGATSLPSGAAPTAQQIVQQYPPSSTHTPQPRGPGSQRSHSNGRRPPGRDQVRGQTSPKSQSHNAGQIHVNSQQPQSQPQGQVFQPSQTGPAPPQPQFRDTQPPVAQEPLHRELDREQRTEQGRLVEQARAVTPPVSKPQQQDETLSQHQVPQQNQQAQHDVRHAQSRAQPSAKKAAKGQFAQPGNQTSHSHPSKSHHTSANKGGRRSENFVWQAKEASGSSGQVAIRPSPQTVPLRQLPEAQIARQSSPSPVPQTLNANSTESPMQPDRAVVILPSDLNAYDSNESDASLNLHFGNFGTTAAPKVEMPQRPVSSAVSRPPVARPVTTPAPKENKEPLESSLVTSQPSNATTLPPVQARKPATRPPEKKQPPQQQQPLRQPPIPTMGIDSGLSDDLAFGQQNPHMQINPQAFSSYNPGHFHFMPSGPAFGLSELDPSANPSLAHQMNFYDPQAFSQASVYRASSPHQGDISPKYQASQYPRDTKYPQQQAQTSSPVPDRHDKHRQDSESPPPRSSSHTQQLPQSPQSPPPGQHPAQPQPLPYSMTTSQYPQVYGYTYQYGYPAASSQFTPGFSRGYPVPYPKPFPNLSNTTSGGFPLSPPTSSGYPDEVQMLGGDYAKSYMPPVMQSFFHTGMPDPASGGVPTHTGLGGKAQTTHTPPSSNTPHGSAKSQQSSFPNSVSSVNQTSDMSTNLPYKDYSVGDLRGTSHSASYYKGYPAGQPSAHQPQFGGQQAGQYGQAGQYQGNGQGQYPFHQPHPQHQLMQGQPQQQNSNLSPQAQSSFP